MKQEKISDALDLLPEELLEQAQSGRVKKKRKRRWPKWVAVAACFCIVVAGVWETLDRLDHNFFEGSGGSFPGQFAGEAYYYLVPHEGVMRYTPGGESERMLHTYWFEEWQVNEYGIYYRQDMSIYVKDHETGTRTKLYSASWPDSTHIGFTLTGDGNVILTAYNKDTEVVYELLLDGISGEVLETVMGPTSYDVAKYAYYSDMNFIVGDRRIVLEPVDAERYKFIPTENGEAILPDGVLVEKWVEHFDGALWLSLRRDGTYDSATTARYALVHPDGATEIITVPNRYYYGGTTEYLFAVDYGEVLCVEVSTGDSWLLEMDAETDDLHDLATDGVHLYTMAPWADEQMCWKLEYDGTGKPIGMSLVSADIAHS